MKPTVVLVVRIYERFSESLRESGCEVLNLEVIRTEPVDDLTELSSKLSRIDDYDGLFFTSRAAAEVFVSELKKIGGSINAKVYVLGRRAKDVLNAAGLDVVFRESANTAEEVIASFDAAEFAGKKLLFVRGDRSMRTIPVLLNGIADVDEVVVYRTVPVRHAEDTVQGVGGRLKRNEVDWICFFSPSGVESFTQLFDTTVTNGVRTAAIGNTTARKATECGFDVQFVPQCTDGIEFADEFIEFLKKK